MKKSPRPKISPQMINEGAFCGIPMPTNNPIFIYHEWYEEHDKLSYRQQEVLDRSSRKIRCSKGMPIGMLIRNCPGESDGNT